MAPSPLTVWYDGACPLCTREIVLMRRLGLLARWRPGLRALE